MIGSTFERWTVLAEGGRAKNGSIKYLCRCECGTQREVLSRSLKAGVSKSCGCLMKELAVKRKSRLKHGLTNNHPLWKKWINMRDRCNNPNGVDYQRYGARGIKVDEQWDDFEQFIKDMGEQPKGTTLDRIGVNGNYSAENCRWATHKQQARNKTNSVMLKAFGKIKQLNEWADDFGINHHRIRQRLAMGWTSEKALTTKIRSYKNVAI